MMRRMLRIILESDPQIRVVGEAGNGQEALEQVAELRPHVITMDVRMPVMDGLETTEKLMAYYPTPILVITASLASYDIDITFEMLDAGALEIMEKPKIKGKVLLESSRHELIRRVKTLARMKVVTHLRGRRSKERMRLSVAASKQQAEQASTALAPHKLVALPTAAPALQTQEHPAAEPPRSTRQQTAASANFPLIVIGASAGGPRVVHQLLLGLPRSLPAAVLVVQHIAEGFGEGMAEWLAGSSALPVHLARDAMPLMVGTVLVAPDGRDLSIQRGGLVRLTDEPLVQQLPRPSVDIAMQSAAEVFGENTIGVLLTGMGRDGALGMQRIRLGGGYTFAQDEASSPIYGMPRAAVELGAVDQVLAPEDIIVALQRQVGKMVARLNNRSGT
jgi:two-component system chemotaxis response regulator CheB